MSEQVLHLKPIDGAGGDLRISADEATIGRDEDVDHTLKHESVSRKHATIHKLPHGWTIRDLDTTHGTFVSGVRVSENDCVSLNDNDQLILGTRAFAVEYSGDPFPPLPTQSQRAPRETRVTGEEFNTRGTLLLRLGADDSIEREVSWQEFHTQYAPIIRGFARNAGCPESLRDDLVQQVMSAFFKAAQRFEYDPARGRFRGYLKTATVNALSRIRHKRRGEVEWDEEQFLEEPASIDQAWTREWIGQTLVRAIAQAKQTSSIAQSSWEAFELYGRRGMPLQAAADQLGMSPSAVTKAKSRVAALVREEIERLRQEEG